MRVVYDGPSDSVEVPAAGLVFVRGVPGEVPDDVGTALLEQKTSWSLAKGKTSSTPTDTKGGE